MKFLIDQDVYAVTIRFFRKLGHDVLPVAQLNLSRADDSELLETARTRDRLFMTRDRDFGGLVFIQGIVTCKYPLRQRKRWFHAMAVKKVSLSYEDYVESIQALTPEEQLVDLELQYLYELGKIAEGPEKILSTLAEDIGLQISTTPFSRIVIEARFIHWTRDPFDRLITAEVFLIENSKLITRDRAIRNHCDKAVW